MKSVVLPLTNGTEKEFKLRKLTPNLRTEISKLNEKFQQKLSSGVDIEREYISNLGNLPEEATTSILASQISGSSVPAEAIESMMGVAISGIMFQLHQEIFKSVVITDGELPEGHDIDWGEVEEELTARVGKFFRVRNSASGSRR